MESADEQIRRLERRLAREQAARAEAEAIAEHGTLKLYERERRQKLLETIAVAANLSRAPGPTFALALTQICEFTRWPVGHLYFTRHRRGRPSLMSARLWHVAQGFQLGAFADATRALNFQPGVGLPGRVLASGQAAWIRDLETDGNFLRVNEARDCGLRAAFAFPVPIGDEVVAVMEFYADRVMPPDPDLLETMAQIGAQLGRVIERTRADRQLRRRNAALRAAIAEAEAQRQAAEAASRAKSAFLAMTSHEVRTPMNAVLGLTHALAREPLTDHQRDLVDGVTDAGAMLLRLLNAVLDISRVERGEHVLDLSPYDPRRTLAAVQRVWRSRADELGVRLHLDLAGLPEPCVLVSDEGKLEQTLINLVSNALKFAPPDSQITVTAALVPLAEGRGRLRLEVIDKGEGIAEADRQRIFEAFEQTRAGRLAGGIGLGLAICAGNLAALGGAIGQDRVPDGGGYPGANRFWLEFEAGTGTPTDLTPDVAVPACGPLRVLAAEDNAANRHVLRVLLEPLEVDLSFAEDGQAAVAVARREAFDLILMDANMPRMDGVEALRLIRGGAGLSRRTPAYMLTANVFEDDIRRYLAAGADGVLKKPVEVQKLLEVLAAATQAA